MATAPTLPLVSADDYLTTSYQPDMEYVDGVLVERSMPTIQHSALRMVLIQYFLQWQSRMSFLALPEVRTQIIERARYRIPDVLLCPKPIPTGGVVNITPPVIIQILSPGDRMGDTFQRFRDYSHINARTIVQMDPDRYIAHKFERGSLIETQFTSLYLPHVDLPVPFDSEALFARLRMELGASLA